MKTKNNSVKRVLKGLKIAVLVLLASIVLLFAGIFIANKLSLRSEAKRIEDYGQKLDVFDGTINVQIDGEANSQETIVLLPGYGTASPILDFKPLIDELKRNYQVVTVEPFGYGLSSQTARERTADNIVEEIHQVTETLGLKNYVVMGHSIAGLYGLNYANAYPDEMLAFVGVDSSVPNQPWPGFDDTLVNFLYKSGIFRAVIKLDKENYQVDSIEPARAEQIRLLTMKNSGNKTIRNEGAHLDESFLESKKLAFPKEMPILLTIAEKNPTTIANWKKVHQEQAASVTNGELIELPGTHYLHHTSAKAIAEETKLFLDNALNK